MSQSIPSFPKAYKEEVVQGPAAHYYPITFTNKCMETDEAHSRFAAQ